MSRDARHLIDTPRGASNPPPCPLCYQGDETINHLLAGFFLELDVWFNVAKGSASSSTHQPVHTVCSGPGGTRWSIGCRRRSGSNSLSLCVACGSTRVTFSKFAQKPH